MVDTVDLDMKKTLIFLIVFIVVLLVYYKKILTIQDNETKPKQMIKRILYIFIIIGLINTFSYTTDKTLKIMLLVVILAGITIYNVHHSLKKCKDISFQYKLTLYVRIILVIITLAILINFVNNNELFSFLYKDFVRDPGSDFVGGGSRTTYTIDLSQRDEMPDYCPDMKTYTSNTAEINKWNDLTNEEKNNCLVSHSGSDGGKGERNDIYSNVYN
jgi:hypothetical protein